MTKRDSIRELAEDSGWTLRENRSNPMLAGGSDPNIDLFGRDDRRGTWLRIRYSKVGSIVSGSAKTAELPWGNPLYGRDKAGQATAFLTDFTPPIKYRIAHQEEWYGRGRSMTTTSGLTVPKGWGSK